MLSRSGPAAAAPRARPPPRRAATEACHSGAARHAALRPAAPRSRGPALVLLGALALLRAACPDPAPVDARAAGRRLDLSVESLAGDGFRLLPGVGPELAERLETARVAAGGTLAPERLEQVPGVGPVLAARWRALASPSEPDPAPAAIPAASARPAGALTGPLPARPQ